MDETVGAGQVGASPQQATDAQLRLLIETVQDYAIFLIDPAGYVISWNAGAERIKGYRADEILGKHFSIFYTEEARAAGLPERDLERAAREGRFEDEGWRVRKDGSYFWANAVINAVRDDSGRLIGFAKVTRDLTERRQAEANSRRLASEAARRHAAEDAERRRARLHADLERALADREPAMRALDAERDRLHNVLQRMPVGVTLVDVDRTFTFANDEAMRLIGANPVGSRLGRHGIYRGFHADGSPYGEHDWPLARALEQGAYVAGEEVTIQTAEGKRFTVSIHAAPLRDGTGKVIGAVAAFQDVTPMREAREIAERQARFREQFIAILGHDLRSPLAAIVAGAHMLLRKGLDPPLVGVVDRILTSADRMERMIGDLLDLTRSRLGGGIPIQRASVDLRGVCRNVIGEFRAAHPDVTMTFEAHGNTWGEWDADRLAQVLSNLVGNAIAYGRPGGPVTIAVEQDEEAESVRLAVHNEGPPIPEEMQRQLFDPFRRGGERARGPAPRGLGLGLYIAHQIVLAHGGTIEVASGAEEGTTFTVHLPRRAVGLADARGA